jgi:hypothetical protein
MRAAALCGALAGILLLAHPAGVAAGGPVETRGNVRSGLVVEISGGWGGEAADLSRYNGLMLAGRLGYAFDAGATIGLRFVSAKEKGESTDRGIQADVQIGSVGGDVQLRILPGSNPTPTLVIGYSYSTRIAEGLPSYGGHGITMGLALIWHFAEHFSLSASAVGSRTWYEPRIPGLGGSAFTGDRFSLEAGVAFYPGLDF